MDEKIFISIASFMDLELYPTIERLLSTADNPKYLYVFVFSQNEDNAHPDLQPLFNQYEAHLNYVQINYKETKGVCWARAKILQNLTTEYCYYLQLDSHMAFFQGWDTVLKNDYSLAVEKYPKCIYTGYPPGYDYQQNRFHTAPEPFIPRVPIYNPNKISKFETKTVDKLKVDLFSKPYGNKTFWFAGGFAFGYSNLFLETPYDPNFFFDGEEHSMTLRMFQKNICFLVPPRPYIFHYYNKDKKIYVKDLPDFIYLQNKANAYIELFMSSKIEGEFGIQPDTIYQWLIASRDER